MYTSIFLLTILMGNLQISASQLGIFEDLTITRYHEDYVMVSRSESCVLLLSNEGKVLARYEKKGEGPQELANPAYLGYYQSRHIVLTQGHFLLAFDNKLVPQSGFVNRIDQSLADELPIFGLTTENGWYWIFSGMSFSDLLCVVSPKKSGIVKLKSLFPQPQAFEDIGKSSNYLQKMVSNSQI